MTTPTDGQLLAMISTEKEGKAYFVTVGTVGHSKRYGPLHSQGVADAVKARVFQEMVAIGHTLAENLAMSGLLNVDG